MHWSVSNSLIRFYLQPCTNAEWGMKGNQWLSLHQTVDAKKEKIFSPDLLIALRWYAVCGALGFLCCQAAQARKNPKKNSQVLLPVIWGVMTLMWRHCNGIGVLLLNDADDIRRCKIISYGRLTHSSVWHRSTVDMSYGRLTKSSVWH